MSEVDLNEMSIDELEEIAQRIDAELERRRIQQINEAAQQIRKIANDLGKSVEEVMTAGTQTKTKGEPKYRNPDDPSQTWTGRGKRPNWVHEALGRGKELEDLEIR